MDSAGDEAKGVPGSSVSWRLSRYGGIPERTVVDVPVPRGREVLLRVHRAGVCHSDVHIQDGYQDLGDGERIDFADTSMPIPLTMGHEIVGDVIAAGDDAVAADIGARRLIYPWIGCGDCPVCLDGSENLCDDPRVLGIFRHGGYAEHVLVPDARYLVDVDGLDASWACTLACSGLTVYSALKRLGTPPGGGPTVVFGAGGLGLAAISVASALGASQVIACDIDDAKLDAAIQAGATEVVNLDSETGRERLSGFCAAAPAAFVDTVGRPETVQTAIDVAAMGSRLALIGLAGGRMPLPLPLLPFKAMSIIGIYTGTLGELEELVAIARRGELSPTALTVESLDALPASLDALRARKVIGRIVLDPTR